MAAVMRWDAAVLSHPDSDLSAETPPPSSVQGELHPQMQASTATAAAIGRHPPKSVLNTNEVRAATRG